MLKRHVDVFANPFVVVNQTEQSLLEIIGIGIEEPDPLNPWYGHELSEQSIESGPIPALPAIGREILGDKIDFFNSLLGQHRCLLHHRIDRAAAVGAAKLWDDAKGALVVASLRNLDEGRMGRGGSQPRDGMVIKIARNPDVEPFFLAVVKFPQDLGYSRDFSCSYKEVHLGQLFGQLLWIPLR